MFRAVQALQNGREGGDAELEQSIRAIASSRGGARTLAEAYRAAPWNDFELRWKLLYLAEKIGDADIVPLLVEVALDVVISGHSESLCIHHRDHEVAVGTMAIAALGGFAPRSQRALEGLIAVLGAKPERALGSEAIRALCHARTPTRAVA